jgi:hypothetical protein
LFSALAIAEASTLRASTAIAFVEKAEDVERVADLLAADQARNEVELLGRTADLRADGKGFLVTDLAGGCWLAHQRLPFLSAAWPGK